MAIKKATERNMTARVLLWGRPGVGKSSWALEATRYGGVLVIDYEEGTQALQRRFNEDNLYLEEDLPRTRAALVTYLKALAANPPAEIKTLVIDSITYIWDQHYQAVRDAKIQKPQWRELLDAIVEVSRHMSVILIARSHAEYEGGNMREVGQTAFVEDKNTLFVVDYWAELRRDDRTGQRHVMLQKSRDEQRFPLNRTLPGFTYAALMGHGAPAAASEAEPYRLQTGPLAGHAAAEALQSQEGVAWVKDLHARHRAGQMTDDRELADLKAIHAAHTARSAG